MEGQIFVILFFTIAAISMVMAVAVFVSWSLYALFGIKGSRENWPGWMLYFDSGWPLFPRWLVGTILSAILYAIGSLLYDLPGERIVFEVVPNFILGLFNGEAA